MSSKPGKRLDPDLRFPGFQKSLGWEQTTLGKIATFEKGKGISKAEIAEGGILPCVRYGELYTCYGETIDRIYSYTNVSPNELVLSQENDVIIPASGETEADIATASCVLKGGIALGSDLNIIRSKLNGVFLSYYLNSARKQAIARLAQGISVVHLYPRQLKTLRIATPLPLEQRKIADCLSSLDDLIGAQAKKIEVLKAHKKGLMQQLFPAEGETEPRLRFSRFRNAGEWKTKKITNILEKVSNPVDVQSGEFYREIGIRSHGKGIFHKEMVSGDQLGNKRVFWVEKNTLVLNIVFAWEQAVATVSKEECGMIASHRFPMFKGKNKASVEFVKHFLLTNKGKFLLGLASPGGAGRNRTLGQKEFENLEFHVPEDLDEQVLIADCLSALDTLISAHTQKLDILKIHKKGLMQGLFPLINEAEA